MLRGENPIGADIRRVFWIRWQIIIRRCNEDTHPFPSRPLSRRYRGEEGRLFSSWRDGQEAHENFMRRL